VNDTDLDCTDKAFCYTTSMKCTDLAKKMENFTLNVSIDDTTYQMPGGGFLVQDVFPN